MNSTPGNALVVRTAWLTEATVWVWEIVDACSGHAIEKSWPLHWAGYDTREVAEHAGVARLRELAGIPGSARGPSSGASAHGRDVAVGGGARHAGRSVLIVVPRSNVDLYQSLKRTFADDAKAEVVLDRRFKERRARSSDHDVERRKEDRRRRPEIDAQLRAGRWVTVPIVSQAVSFSDPDARAILFLCCSAHVVRCQKCQNTYRLGSLPRTDPGLFPCPLCGFDITPAVEAHTATCAYWLSRGASRKPSTALESPRPPASTVPG